jgi:hypothetical protein
MGKVVRLAEHRRRKTRIAFTRSELNQLFSLYSRHVIRGEWRDYAIDHGERMAAFSVYRRSIDPPLFTITKTKLPGHGTDRFRIESRRGRLHEGSSLAEALSQINKLPHLVTQTG